MSQVYIFVLEIYLIVLAWKLWIFFFLNKNHYLAMKILYDSNQVEWGNNGFFNF